jgi:hypothetical protein
MGQAIEVLTGFVTAPSTTLTALTMASGDSLTIRNTNLTTKVSLLSTWAFNNAAGVLRIRSPRLHDNVQGIRTRVDATDSRPIYPRWMFDQPLIPQDTLIAELSGSAVGGQIETASLLIFYADLLGVSGRFCTSEQYDRWSVNMMGQEVAITTGAGGGYTGSASLVANFDNTKANTDYALIGYRVDANCCTVGIKGVDTGNLRVGGPGAAAQPDLTATWFGYLSNMYGIAAIPIFNAANKNAIFIDVAQNQAAAAVNVTLFLTELMPASLRK